MEMKCFPCQDENGLAVLFYMIRKSISRIWMNYVLQCQHKHYNETGGGLIWLIYQVLLEEIFLICLKME